MLKCMYLISFILLFGDMGVRTYGEWLSFTEKIQLCVKGEGWDFVYLSSAGRGIQKNINVTFSVLLMCSK